MGVIAALYVATGGCYFGLDGVDPWDEARDARLYAGPWPVVAHPPCERWGRYATGGPSHAGKFKLGDDGGCFAAALASVRTWGGRLGAPRGLGCVEGARADSAEPSRGVDECRGFPGMDVLRRARIVRSSRSEGDMAICGACAVAVAGMGKVKEGLPETRRWLSQHRGASSGYEARCNRAHGQARAHGHAAALLRPIALHCQERA